MGRWLDRDGERPINRRSRSFETIEWKGNVCDVDKLVVYEKTRFSWVRFKKKYLNTVGSEILPEKYGLSLSLALSICV